MAQAAVGESGQRSFQILSPFTYMQTRVISSSNRKLTLSKRNNKLLDTKCFLDHSASKLYVIAFIYLIFLLRWCIEMYYLSRLEIWTYSLSLKKSTRCSPWPKRILLYSSESINLLTYSLAFWSSLISPGLFLPKSKMLSTVPSSLLQSCSSWKERQSFHSADFPELQSKCWVNKV